jgi:hypothetical protein
VRHAGIWLTVIIALGSALRLHPYLANRSLWVDEAMLALNVVGRSFAGLLEPLDHLQLAPVGFLMICRAAVTAFGANEYALRLLPLLAGLAAMPLTFALTRLAINRRAALVATALLALAPSAIYYAQEFKQYSSDLIMSLAVVWLATSALRAGPTPRRLIWLAVVGCAAIWVSHPACLVAAAAGSTLLVLQIRLRRWDRALGVGGACGLWLISVILSHAHSLRATETVGHMTDFWWRGFLPVPLHSVDQVARWPAVLLGLFAEVFSSPMDLSQVAVRISMLVAVVWLAGAVALWHKDRWQLALLTLPLLFALIAAALNRYPLVDRLTLFMLPLVVVVVAAGVDSVWSFFPGRRLAGNLLVVALLCLPTLAAVRSFTHPPRCEEIKSVLSHLARHRRPADTVWLYPGAGPAFRFYTRFVEPARWADLEPVWGRSHRKHWRDYWSDLQELRGRERVWMVFTHVHGGDGADERRLILFMLDQIGRRESRFAADGAWIYLYDLSQADDETDAVAR